MFKPQETNNSRLSVILLPENQKAENVVTMEICSPPLSNMHY